jgi:anti-sigma factor RsiW
MTGDHERYQDDVGAYLLGALEPAEQAAFEGHMAGCPECRAAVEQLRVAANALPRSVEPFAPPPSLKRSLMEAVREDAAAQRARERRPLLERLGLERLLSGMRPEIAWVGAAFLLAIGIALGVGVGQLSGGGGDGGSKDRVVAAMVDRSRIQNAHATLTVPSDKTGPAQLRVSGLPKPRPGQVYEVWLLRGNRPQPATLFNVDSQGNGVGAIPDDLRGVSAVLVTRERTGGAQTPSEMPIISARI